MKENGFPSCNASDPKYINHHIPMTYSAHSKSPIIIETRNKLQSLSRKSKKWSQSFFMDMEKHQIP